MPETHDGGGGNVTFSNPVTEQGFTQIPNAVLLREDIGILAKVIYGYVMHLGWKNDLGRVALSVEVVSEHLNVSEHRVRAAFRELANAPCEPGDADEEAPKLLPVTRRGQGLPNVYTINDPVQSRSAEIPVQGDSRTAENAVLEPQNQPLPLTSQDLEVLRTPLPPYEQVFNAWLANAPPLVKHKPSYFDEKVKRKAKDAIKRHGLDDVLAAISAFAQIVAAPQAFWWKYKFPLGDFLTAKNLDKFVPESDPLTNFRERNGSKPPPGGAYALTNTDDYSIYNRYDN